MGGPATRMLHSHDGISGPSPNREQLASHSCCVPGNPLPDERIDTKSTPTRGDILPLVNDRRSTNFVRGEIFLEKN